MDIRDLAERVRRFFAVKNVLPIYCNNKISLVTQYENAVARLEEFYTGADFLDMTATGPKLIKVIPEGEIWIPEKMRATRTSGAAAEFNAFQVQLKNKSTYHGFGASVTAAATVDFYRGVQYPATLWLYPGDSIYANVSTSDAGDYGGAYVIFRRLKVGDDY